MRKSTSEKIQAELERKQQIENGIKKLQQQQKAEERKARDKRHRERERKRRITPHSFSDMKAVKVFITLTAFVVSALMKCSKNNGGFRRPIAFSDWGTNPTNPQQC